MRFFLLLFLSAVMSVAVAQPDTTGRIKKSIVYKSAVAGEVYMVWAVNYWMSPDTSMWPANTHLQGKMAYTKMNRSHDSFFVSFSLPLNTRLDYFFWVPKNAKGEVINGWDTNAKMNFLTEFKSPETIFRNDSKLFIAKKGFNLLQRGALFLFFAVLAFSLLVYFFLGRGVTIRKSEWMTGLLISSISFIGLARLQVAFSEISLFTVPGALFSDLLLLFFMSVLFFPLYLYLRKRRFMANLVLGLFTIILISIVLASLLNIEVVNHLGTPFNYKWLYYSDFLKGNDARDAVAHRLTNGFVRNILLLLFGCLLTGYSIAVLLHKIYVYPKARLFVWAGLGVFFCICLIQSKTHVYHKAKVQSPVLAFVTSVADPSGDKILLDQPVPDSVKAYIRDYHNNPYTNKFDSSGLISNVILFVSESTPQQWVSLYDSTYLAMPHLLKRQSMASVYTNMYAHIPSTPNSMFSLLTGLYPRIDYRSSLLEKPQKEGLSLPVVLKDARWRTSLFFSSDLSYSDMDAFSKNSGVSFAQDYETLNCAERFSDTRSEIDGVNDSCLLTNYFDWFDKKADDKSFSILWTNQTHYPYYTDKNVIYNAGNDDLNRFLNALHHTDEIFEALMQGLESRNQLKSTLVIFIADHGEAFGTHDQRLHASGIYQENVRIPCLLFNPVLFNGTRNNDMHGLIDIAPTISHLLGIKKPTEWQGKTLFLPNKNGRTFFTSPYTDLLVGTVNGNWKYIYNAETGAGELYDIATDPGELKNLASLYPDKAAAEHTMVAAWVQYQKENFAGWKK